MKNPLGEAFSILGLAAHVGRGAGRVATDAVVGGRFGLPRTVEDINPAVLSRVIGANVRSIRVLSRDAGTSSRGRLVLTGKNVPDSVFVKVAAQTAATRLMGELGRLGHTEVRFYRELGAAGHRPPLLLRRGIRRLDRPVPACTGGPAGGVVRVPGHVASAVGRPGQLDHRATGRPARHLLGTAAA
jgi:hypothetical protein